MVYHFNDCIYRRVISLLLYIIVAYRYAIFWDGGWFLSLHQTAFKSQHCPTFQHLHMVLWCTESVCCNLSNICCGPSYGETLNEIRVPNPCRSGWHKMGSWFQWCFCFAPLFLVKDMTLDMGGPMNLLLVDSSRRPIIIPFWPIGIAYIDGIVFKGNSRQFRA